MTSQKINLLVGLGNPGKKYQQTRHNIGFSILRNLAIKESVTFKQSKKVWGEIAEIRCGDVIKRLLLPTTFMNESGRSIKATLDWFGLKTNQLLVLVDDMDLPLGKLRLRKGGGAGGHNGLKSTIQHLGTKDFSRLRIGIGAPADSSEERKAKTVSHVLGQFTSKESLIINEVINEVIEGLNLIDECGLDKTINQINSYQPREI